MPRFTLIKHADSQYDSEIKMEFEAEVLDLARAHYEDFLNASGFVTQTETTEDWLEKAEDMMWDDAFSSKFSYSSPTPLVKHDGPVGSTGDDVIFLGDYQKEPFIPTFHD